MRLIVSWLKERLSRRWPSTSRSLSRVFTAGEISTAASKPMTLRNLRRSVRRTSNSNGSSPTSNSRTWPSGRYPGETSKPGPETIGGRSPDRPPRYLRTSGLSGSPARSRSTRRGLPIIVDQELELRYWLVLFAKQRPRYGYRRACAIASKKGFIVNRKRVQRILMRGRPKSDPQSNQEEPDRLL